MDDFAPGQIRSDPACSGNYNSTSDYALLLPFGVENFQPAEIPRTRISGKGALKVPRANALRVRRAGNPEAAAEEIHLAYGTRSGAETRRNVEP
jgi:hypothetical protein